MTETNLHRAPSEQVVAGTIQAKTSTTGELFAKEIVSFFEGKPDAFLLWAFAMNQPATWVFRKTHLKRFLGIGERRWREAIDHLRAGGLLEIPFRRDTKGKMIGRCYSFYGWNERRIGRDIMKRQDYTGFSGDIDKGSDACILPSLEESTQLCISEGDVKGDGLQIAALVSQASENLVIDENLDEMMRGDRERFLARFHGVKTWQTFDDSPQKRRELNKIFHRYLFQIEQLNDRGAGVFLTINETDGTGRKRDNIVAVRAVFVDLDGAPLAPVLAYEPHMVVESSPGRYHCYWFVKGLPLEAFSDIQKQLARMFGGDPVVHDLSRVMRVPGFVHRKGAPFVTRIISELPDAPVLSYLDIVRKFPPEPREMWSAKKKPVTQADYTGPYGTSEGNRNNGLFKFIGGAIKRRTKWSIIESEAYRWAAACTPPLPDSEVAQILRSARRYVS